MNEKPNYYSITPAFIRYDNDLVPAAKLLYGEITALSNKEGYCWASDNYFATLYNTTTRTIQRWLKQLKDKGYIHSQLIYKENSKEIEKRILTIVDQNTIKRLSINIKEGTDKNVTTPIDIEKQETKCADNLNSTPSDKNVITPADINSLDNTINNNTININTNSESNLSGIDYNSKKAKDVLKFIETNYSDNPLKEIINKWYIAVGKGRVTVNQLNDKIDNLNTIANGNFNEMYNIINDAYLNSWIGFFANKEKHDQQFHMPQRTTTVPSTRNQAIELSDEVF